LIVYLINPSIGLTFENDPIYITEYGDINGIKDFSYNFTIPAGWQFHDRKLEVSLKDNAYEWDKPNSSGYSTGSANSLPNALLKIEEIIPNITFFNPSREDIVESTINYSPVPGFVKGDIAVYYGSGGNYIKKPLVIVEGIDFDDQKYDWKRFYRKF
jgi:hypothetical protein